MVEKSPQQQKETTVEQKRSVVAADGPLDTVITLVTVMGALVVSLFFTVGAMFMALVPRSYRRHDISGQVALVTGGGSGIGRLLIVKLAKKGVKVITWDVNAAGNAETVRQVKAEGYDCLAYTVDLCDRHAIYRTAAEMLKANIKVDILVNNAGIVTGRNFLDVPDEHVVRTFDVNVLCHFWTAKAFLPAMMKANKGHIVTIASMAGKVGVNKLIDYCASKFAAVGFDESLRAELMVNNYDGVHTTLVCPTYINTGMFEGVKSKLIPILEPEFVAEEILDGILLRSKEVMCPFYLNIFVLLKFVLSNKALVLMYNATGASDSMDDYIGHGPLSKKKN